MSRWAITRDSELQTEHQRWGTNLPAVDIDHLVVEYSHCRPMALVEYKHESAKKIDLCRAGFAVLVKLGDAAGLPVFVARYADDFKWWKVFPLNDRAREIVQDECRDMDKKEFVTFLYTLRGVVPPGYLWGKLGLDK